MYHYKSIALIERDLTLPRGQYLFVELVQQVFFEGDGGIWWLSATVIVHTV